jgi:predicted RNase H-like HicB family nuclease
MDRDIALEYWLEKVWYVGRLREAPGPFSQGKSVKKLREKVWEARHLMVEEAEEVPTGVEVHTKELGVES